MRTGSAAGVNHNADDSSCYLYTEISDTVITLDEYYRDGHFEQEESFLKLEKQ